MSKTINPVVTFGLNLNVGYKAFDLTLNFTGAANVGRAFTKEAFGEFSGSAGHPSTAWLDSWTPENTNASMPREDIAIGIYASKECAERYRFVECTCLLFCGEFVYDRFYAIERRPGDC